MATYNFTRPNLSRENAEVQEYLLRLLNELDHIAFDDKANVNNYSTTEVYEDSSIEEEASFTGGTYRKWKSGLAEVWGTVNVTIGTLTQWGLNGLNATDDSYYLTYPSIFTTVPSVQATVEKDSNSVLLATVEKGTASVSPKYKLIGLSNQALQGQTATLHIYAVGRWK